MSIAARASAHGPTPEYSRAASVTRAADQLLARLLADDADPGLCARTADRLTESADAVARRRRLPPMQVSGDLLIRLRMLEAAMWERDSGIENLPAAERVRLSRPGPALVGSASRLALCTGLAYAAFYVLPVAHGYWIALTVALVMKPDLGSQAVFLTPLIMILLDLVVPDESIRVISEARIATTFIGGLIVVVFGYLIWPSQRHIGVAAQFDATLADLARYARDVAEDVGPPRVGSDRRSIYRRLSDTRVNLQRILSEPPPAGAEAWAWIPVVSAAERITDRITGASAARTPAPTDDLIAVADALDRMSVGSGSTAGRTPTPPAHAGDSTDADVRQLADEIAHLRTLLAR